MLTLRCSSLRDGAHHGTRALHRAPPSTRRAPVKRVYCSAPTAPSMKKPSEVSLGMGLALGGFGGVLSALSGVGSGMVLVPTVAKLTNFSMQTVNGACLAALTVGVAAGAYNYSQADACNYPLALFTTLPSILFARVGVDLAHRVSSKMLLVIVGYSMLVSVPFVVLKNSDLLKQLRAEATSVVKPVNPFDLQYYTTNPNKPEGDSDEAAPAPSMDNMTLLEAVRKDPLAFGAANLQYMVVGALSGFVVGFCGVGASIVTTTYLTAGTDLPQAAVIGMSVVSALPMSAATNYYYYKSKSIHVPTAFKIGGSLVMGIYATSKLILEYQKVPEDALRAVLATAIGAASIAMIRRAI